MTEYLIQRTAGDVTHKIAVWAGRAAIDAQHGVGCAKIRDVDLGTAELHAVNSALLDVNRQARAVHAYRGVAIVDFGPTLNVVDPQPLRLCLHQELA